MSWRDGVTSRKCCATNDVLYLFSNDLFIADAILHRTNRAIPVEDMRGSRDCSLRVDGLGRDDAVIAPRQFIGITGSIQPDSEFRCSGEPKSVFPNGVCMLFPDVIRPCLSIARFGQMRSEQATRRAAANYANLQQIRSCLSGKRFTQ